MQNESEQITVPHFSLRKENVCVCVVCACVCGVCMWGVCVGCVGCVCIYILCDRNTVI